MASKASPAPPIAVPSTVAAPVAAGRVEWVDAARGLAILLVVFGHAAGGLIDGSSAGQHPVLRALFLAIYTFHMPAFFFLCGLFIEQRLKRGITPFVSRLLTTIVWAYFLWSIVQFTLIYAAGSFVNHPAGDYWGTILALPWRPVSQFWFLHALFLIHLLGIAAWRVGGARAVLAAAITVKLIALFVPSTPALSMAAANAPYYAIGMLIGCGETSRLLGSATPAVRAAIIVGAAAVIVILCSLADTIQSRTVIENASGAAIAKVAWMPAMLPAAVLGTAALLLIADRLARSDGPAARAFAYLGTMTMPIFLLHIIFIAGLRIVLEKLFGMSGAAVLPLLVLAGVAGPLLVRQATDRLGLTTALALR